MYAENLCKWEKGCRACREACPVGSIRFAEDGRHSIDRDACLGCKTFDCISWCPNGALKQCVRDYTEEDLVRILRRDFNNWGPEGGVTFTGGDPLMQHGFLLEVLKQCRTLQIHTAIETTAYARPEVFLDVLQYINFAFVDVKHMDPVLHKRETGVGNELILSNITALAGSGWPGRLVLRQPVIGGYNDGEENALRVIDFMTANGLYEINLLKFHPLGETKWNQLGKAYPHSGRKSVDAEHMHSIQQLYLRHNIACYLGEDTPF
jgi:pyruvate formate lyase activating enzyme